MILSFEKYLLSLLLIDFLHHFDGVNSARILAAYPTISRSHYIVAEALLIELSQRGHEITVISAFPQSKPLPNFRDIKLELDEEIPNFIKDIVEHSADTFYFMSRMGDYMRFTMDIVKQALNNPEFQKIMKNEQFDLFIMEELGQTDCLLGLGAHFNVPIIMITSIEPTPPVNSIIGNPSPYAYVPHMMTGFKAPMTFVQRMLNQLMSMVGELMLPFFYNEHYVIYNQYFPHPKYPSLDEMRKNVSVIFTNYHFTQGNPRPNVPALIDIGGIQVKDPPSPLPANLQTWLDDATTGAIYMSMGTNIQSSEMSSSKLDAICKTFATLDEKIIWKFENDSLHGLPSNVMLSKWLPQSDLLAHPNIKLFISHGGLGGIIEAKYHGVPILGIPFFGDQITNVMTEVERGVALVLSYANLTQETFTYSVNEILTNPKYRDRSKEISKLFRDRPQKPMETAVFWTEYVLRHHGAKHMQSNSVFLNNWQLYSLDVIGLLLVVFVIVGFINICVLKWILRKLFGAKSKSKND